jgi:hypothetical protein
VSQTPSAVALATLQTTEGEQDIVKSYYEALVGIQPKPQILRELVETLNSSQSEELVIANIIDSPAYLRGHGRQNARALAMNIYENLLQQAPTTQQLHRAETQDRSAKGRINLVTQISSSPEFQEAQIVRFYAQYLGRTPDSQVVAYLRSLWGSEGSLAVQASILGNLAP